MRLYTVHLGRHRLDAEPDLVLIKEGFCWPALFFTAFWALWHRMWLVAVALFVVNGVLSGLAHVLGLDPVSAAAVSAGFAAIVGFVANDLRRWSLERRGFIFSEVVSGADRDTAARNYLVGLPKEQGA
jgi:hypothetical protein